jgi:hypothetical protein
MILVARSVRRGSRSRDLGQLRGERLTLARFVSTLPALEAKIHSNRGALCGQIL